MNVNEISHQVLLPTGLRPISSLNKNPQGSLPRSRKDISALGLRHVGYGIPTEFFAPFVCLGARLCKRATSPLQWWQSRSHLGKWHIFWDEWWKWQSDFESLFRINDSSNLPRFITSRSLHPAEGSPIPPRISAEVSSHSSRTTWCENQFFNGHFRIRLIGVTYHI